MSASERRSIPYENLPFVGDELAKLVYDIDIAAGDRGFTSGVATVLKERNARISTTISPDTLSALSQSPCIVALDHSQLKNAEVLAVIASLPTRTNLKEGEKDNTFLYAAEEWCGLTDNLVEPMLPLRVSGPSTGTWREHSLRYYGVKRKKLGLEDGKFNLSKLKEGIDRINKGGRGVICPDGTHPEDGWNGIGKIASRVNPSTQLIFATSTGLSSNFDLRKLCWPWKESAPFISDIIYSEPITIATLKELQLSNTDLDKYLQLQYLNWKASLQNLS